MQHEMVCTRKNSNGNVSDEGVTHFVVLFKYPTVASLKTNCVGWLYSDHVNAQQQRFSCLLGSG